MFENLSDRLERSFQILKGQGRITEINVAETLRDVRRALLEADVNFNTAKQFSETVKEKAYKTDRNIKQTALNTIYVQPGSHVVSVSVSGNEIYKKTVFLSATEHRIVEL